MMSMLMKSRLAAASVDAPIEKETVEMFLARGGSITRCPSKPALGPMMYTPTIMVDGHTLPIGTVGHDYIPNFVRDLASYDIAQSEVLTPEQDGSAMVVRHDARRSAAPAVAWREAHIQSRRREDDDLLEQGDMAW